MTQKYTPPFTTMNKIAEINYWDVEDLKKFHGIMTAGLIGESGTFRRGNEGVFHGERCIFIAPPPSMVPGLVEGLFSWMEMAEWPGCGIQPSCQNGSSFLLISL